MLLRTRKQFEVGRDSDGEDYSDSDRPTMFDGVSIYAIYAIYAVDVRITVRSICTPHIETTEIEVHSNMRMCILEPAAAWRKRQRQRHAA